MDRKNLIQYGVLLTALIGADIIFISQFGVGSIGLILLIIKDLLIIIAMIKLSQNSFQKSFTTFADNIIDAQTDQVDLTVRLPVKDGVQNTVSTQLNEGFQRTHDVMLDIEASVSRLIPMSTELADTYSATTQKTLMQTNYSQSVAQSMDRMHQASDTVSSDIGNINAAVVSSNEYVNSCRTAVESAVQSIHVVSENMEQASDKLAKLKKASEEVSTVIEVINSIAEQTNLLALNAAIEAARAGEMGRGFAVVADEVRTLAERTRVSTSEVRDNIERIQSQTNELVDSMSQGQESTEVTVERSEDSRKQLDKIFNAVEDIQSAAEQINGSISIQTNAANEAQSSIEGLVELNTDALESTRLHSVSKDDLHNLAEALKGKIATFKLNQHQWDENARSQTRSELEDEPIASVVEDAAEVF